MLVASTKVGAVRGWERLDSGYVQLMGFSDGLERKRGSQWAWAAGRTLVAAIGKVEGGAVGMESREIWNSI